MPALRLVSPVPRSTPTQATLVTAACALCGVLAGQPSRVCTAAVRAARRVWTTSVALAGAGIGTLALAAAVPAIAPYELDAQSFVRRRSPGPNAVRVRRDAVPAASCSHLHLLCSHPSEKPSPVWLLPRHFSTLSAPTPCRRTVDEGKRYPCPSTSCPRRVLLHSRRRTPRSIWPPVIGACREALGFAGHHARDCRITLPINHQEEDRLHFSSSGSCCAPDADPCEAIQTATVAITETMGPRSGQSNGFLLETRQLRRRSGPTSTPASCRDSGRALLSSSWPLMAGLLLGRAGPPPPPPPPPRTPCALRSLIRAACLVTFLPSLPPRRPPGPSRITGRLMLVRR